MEKGKMKEQLDKIYSIIATSKSVVEKFAADFSAREKERLFGNSASSPNGLKIVSSPQTKRRIKRLSSLNEDELEPIIPSASAIAPKINGHIRTELFLNTEIAENSVRIPLQESDQNDKFTEVLDNSLMPPPPNPNANINHNLTSDENRSSRPQRAAKLKSEKNLKEPSLNRKLRRQGDEVVIKLEHEHRQSQILVTSEAPNVRSSSVNSTKTEDSIVVVTEQPQPVVEIHSDEEQQCIQNDNNQKEATLNSNVSGDDTRKLRVRVKREKLSNSNEKQSQSLNKLPQISKSQAEAVVPATNEKESVNRSSSDESAKSQNKKGKKNKVFPKPIKVKVERVSSIEESTSPLATRTRKGSTLKNDNVQLQSNETQNPVRSGSIYEDAVDNLTNDQNNVNTITPIVPISVEKVVNNNEIAAVNTSSGNNKVNATVVLSSNGAASDETFCANSVHRTFQMGPEQSTFVVNEPNPNATVTLSKNSEEKGDATFKVSMETARNTLTANENSLITEDESFEKPPKLLQSVAPRLVKSPSTKAFKMPLHSNELFNPLIQSPVKMKVKAFENVAHPSTNNNKPILRLRTKKENASPAGTSNFTPTIGKLTAPSLGRFLTPTQSSNTTPNVITNVKKTANSASKAIPFSKTVFSITKKPLSRENSAEEFRKGINQLAEERKKQRDQKHLLAAQQREAKERERAEKVAKLAKEREEKRIKKQEAEQKLKWEMEENARKQRQGEEAAELAKQKAKAKAIADKEREMLKLQMKQQIASTNKKMMPPPSVKPPIQYTSKYNFDMLHEDDSTDEEDKTTYKRPKPPTWSLANVRGPAILMQQHLSTDIIDSFFSVQPTTPDLRLIFPNIDARHLKRNSSVLWSTPPRYSELPKY